jgi:two-component system sensor histidine kinase PilS (NtrC family)
MTEGTLINKLKALIAFRVFFVTAILGSFLVFQIGYDIFPYPTAVQYLIITLYSLTFVYVFLLGKVRSLPFAYVQLCLDVVGAIALIMLTGGIESWFNSMLLLIVLEAAIVVNKRAGYVTAILGCLLYGSLIDLQYYGILPVPYDPMLIEKHFLYKIFSLILALFLTAYLTGLLSSRLERKQIDLQDLALFNKEVIESTPSGLFTTDIEGRINLFNRAAENITGVDRASARGLMVDQVFPFIGTLAERLRMEEVAEFRGSKKIIGLSLSLMKDAKGAVKGYIGIFQDLTELKKLAEEIKQKEKLAAIGEMSANMAHEIRNPLASLKSSMEMLRENTIREEQKDRLMSIALSEMDRLNVIITDFLNYSRPMALETRKFDLHEVISQTMELLGRRDASSASVSFRKNFNGSLHINGDPQKLQQVFWNLGLNALDAMPDGGDLTVSTEEKDKSVLITFADTGTGVDPGDLKRIFFPFFTTKKDGTGLGLSIAYRIVEKHNGKITLNSVRGKGTRFDILIPQGT